MSENQNKPAVEASDFDDLLQEGAEQRPESHRAKALHDRVLGRIRDSASSSFLTMAGGAGEWVEAAPGNHVKVLRTDDETMSILVRLDPGATFPSHSHPADEETYVIAGETWFGDTFLQAGDYHMAPKGSQHGEVRTDTGCTLFIRKSAQD